jgi:hypothetical protein
MRVRQCQQCSKLLPLVAFAGWLPHLVTGLIGEGVDLVAVGSLVPSGTEIWPGVAEAGPSLRVESRWPTPASTSAVEWAWRGRGAHTPLPRKSVSFKENSKTNAGPAWHARLVCRSTAGRVRRCGSAGVWSPICLTAQV